MHYLTLLSTVAAVGASAEPVASHYGVRAELPDSYTVLPMTWTGTIKKGGPVMSFNGTVDEIAHRIRSIDKSFTWEGLSEYQGRKEGKGQHAKRKPDHMICDVQGEADWGPYTSQVQDVQHKIEKMTGDCSVPGGPRVCSVIACNHYYAGAWLCNDNDTPITLPCNSLASYVQDIIDQCGTPYIHGHKTTRGQEFDDGNWNVIAGWKNSC